MEPTPPTKQGARVLLGLFILAQLLFLAVNNFQYLFRNIRERDKPLEHKPIIEPIVPEWSDKRGSVEDLMEVLYQSSTRYSQVTGQLQNWCLYAPGVCDYGIFPAVELRWDDDADAARNCAPPLAILAAGDPLQAAALSAAAADCAEPPPPRPRTMLCANEPADPNHYFRSYNFRLRCFECSICVNLSRSASSSEEEQLEVWRSKIRGEVAWGVRGVAMSAYLRWALRA
jgi:hypothetical protein